MRVRPFTVMPFFTKIMSGGIGAADDVVLMSSGPVLVLVVVAFSVACGVITVTFMVAAVVELGEINADRHGGGRAVDFLRVPAFVMVKTFLLLDVTG